MANWTTIRNQHIDSSSSNERARQVLTLLCETLLTAGWSLVGQGGGNGSGVYQFNASGGLTNQFAAFPSSQYAGAWFVARNADGIEICVWNNSGYYLTFVASPADGFVAGSSDEDTPPSDPADSFNTGGSTYESFGNSSYPFFCHISYSDDSNSFIMSSYVSANDSESLCGVLVKLENVDASDASPTYCPYWLAWMAYSSSVWENDALSGGNKGDVGGFHPTAGAWKRYLLLEPKFDEDDVFDLISADPITGEQPRLTCLVGCTEATYTHIRGTVPGIYRVPSGLSSGDLLDSGAYVVMGDYCVPWGSADPMQS